MKTFRTLTTLSALALAVAGAGSSAHASSIRWAHHGSVTMLRGDCDRPGDNCGVDHALKLTPLRGGDCDRAGDDCGLDSISHKLRISLMKDGVDNDGVDGIHHTVRVIPMRGGDDNGIDPTPHS